MYHHSRLKRVCIPSLVSIINYFKRRFFIKKIFFFFLYAIFHVSIFNPIIHTPNYNEQHNFSAAFAVFSVLNLSPLTFACFE